MPNAKSLNFFFNKRYFRNIRFLFTQLKNKHDCFAQSLEKDELVKFYRLLKVNENVIVKKYSPGWVVLWMEVNAILRLKFTNIFILKVV